MTNFLNRLTVRQLLISLLAFYWLVVLNILWFNNGGHGFALPYNLVCWGFMALPVALTLKRIRYSATGLWLLAGAVLMTLPAAWSPNPDALQMALPRLTGLWGGVAFYFLMLQVRFDRRMITALLTILAAAAVVESAVTLVCIWWPQYLPETLAQFAREYSPQGFGVFEQRNVNASFLATGYTGMLALLGFYRGSRTRQFLLAAGVVFVTATLVLVESRIGWIGWATGTVAVGLLANTAFGRRQSTPLQRWLVMILPLVGMGLGILLLSQSVTGVLDEHDGSNLQRLMVLKYTLIMIAMHPIKGWGLGSYIGEFQRFMATQQGSDITAAMGNTIMGHPHNEVLYLWFEGGITALIGGLCCVMGWLCLTRRRYSLWQVVALLMTLPVLLHTQVEYPLYFSVPHFLALLLLMRAADTSKPSRLRAGPLTQSMVAGAVIYGMVLAGQCFVAGQTLLKFENYQLKDMESIAEMKVPWLMERQWGKDMTMLRLVRYKKTKDKAELVAFVRESGRWLGGEPEGRLKDIQALVSSRLDFK